MIVFAGITYADDSGDFNIRVGLGYDFVSQEYFLSSSRYDTSITPEPDLLVSSLLRKDYLDDKKGMIFVNVDPGKEGRYILEAGWEQTNEVFRSLGWGHIGLGNSSNRLETDFNFEVKQRYRGTVEAGEELSVIQGKAKYTRRLSESWEARFRLFGENVAFDSTGPLVYDFSRVGTEIGVSLLTQDFNNVFLSAGFEKRSVPDSSELDYLLVRGDLAYLGGFLGGQISADLMIENKNFGSLEDRDDYTLTTLYSNLRVPVGRGYFMKPGISFEYFNFRPGNYLNDDYLLARSGFLLGRNFNGFSITFGPKVELLSTWTDLQNDDDYLEFLAFQGIDFYHSARAFFLVENQLGRRSYRSEPLYYSDFIFDRASLIGTFKIFAALSLDVLFSAEWEWHEIDSDDSRLYLLSTGLTYTF